MHPVAVHEFHSHSRGPHSSFITYIAAGWTAYIGGAAWDTTIGGGACSCVDVMVVVVCSCVVVDWGCWGRCWGMDAPGIMGCWCIGGCCWCIGAWMWGCGIRGL